MAQLSIHQAEDVLDTIEHPSENHNLPKRWNNGKCVWVLPQLWLVNDSPIWRPCARLLPDMNRPSANHGAWLLLILFSIGSIVPAATSQWLLCVGCEDVAVTISQSNSVWGDAAASCCGTENEQEGDQQPERLTADIKFGVCDCVRLTVDIHDTEIVPTSSNELSPSFALMAESMSESLRLDLYPRASAPRGPPDVSWSSATQTLFGQRTALVI